MLTRIILIVGLASASVAAQDDLQPNVASTATDLAILPEPTFRDLFNGKNLDGWVNVNTDPDTWSAKDGMIVCTGLPIGVIRTDRQYENFVLEIEWRHMEPGGNSGVFLWSDAKPEGNRLPRGMEVQMLELDWVRQHREKGRIVSASRICSRRTVRSRWHDGCASESARFTQQVAGASL